MNTIQRLFSIVLMAGSLLGTPAVAVADPARIAVTSNAPARTAPVDAARYAALEQRSPAAASFRGGGESVYIGGSVLSVVLVLLIIVIIL